MIALHGLWSGSDVLALWAEVSGAARRTSATRPARPTHAARATPARPSHAARATRPARPTHAAEATRAAAPDDHPFAASHADLTAALAAVVPASTVSAGRRALLVLDLPSCAHGPIDSPELVRDEVPGLARGQVSLRGWTVPALLLEPASALTLLGEIDPAQLTVGASIRHLRHVAAFARDLVARGRLLPTVADPLPQAASADPRSSTSGSGTSGSGTSGSGTSGSGTSGSGTSPRARAAVPPRRHIRAVWRPVLVGPDAAWAQALALALPPAGRAAPTPHTVAAWPADAAATPASPPAASPTATTPGAAQTVAAALDALVDAAAREALDAQPPATAEVPAWRAWLAALCGGDQTIDTEPSTAADLAEALATWQRDAVAGRVRACFRLVEPGTHAADTEATDTEAADTEAAETEAAETEAADTNAAGMDAAETGKTGPRVAQQWRLEFALQAAEEPSLVVDAERIWRSRGTLRALARFLDSPQETLLTELGRASRVYPALDEALLTARPVAMGLDGTGAHTFLRDGAPLLAGAGFGVLLPGWWSKPRARLGARLSATSRTAPGTVAKRSALGLDALVDYRWEVSLGDDVLTKTELNALIKLKTPLVRLRGQWVELDPKRLAAGLKIMGEGQMSVGDLLHAGLSTQDGPGGLPVVSVTADGALGEMLSGQVEQRLQPIPTPPDFVGTLRPYQERGLAWLAFLETLGLGPILADDMGLGKSATVLALLAHDDATAPTLLVCPMSLVGNWQREVLKFAPKLRVHVHHGAERARGERFAEAVAGADLVLTTYALAARDAEDLGRVSWHRVVVDEAQAIKNAATRQAAAVRTLPASRRIAVTGTPVENRLADLWSIMEFANPGLLGSATSFKKRYAEPIERHGDDVAAQRLKRLTGPFVLRRVKTDKSVISDLPEKLEIEVVCNLTAEQASLYQAVVTDMLAKIEQSEGIERRGLVLATMTKLKQVCNHPAHLLRDNSRLAGRSGKLARLEEILDEVLAAGDRALLFTQFAEFGAMLRSHLTSRFGREVAFLHGGVSKADRDAMVMRFQAEDSSAPALFVLSLKAGGTGLTLTAANHVVHVDRWWNPAVEDQATDRAFRIGQHRNVQVRKFVCAGTVEEKISAMIAEKRGLAAKIVGAGEQWLTELSTSQLRDLLALDPGAVVE